MYKTVRAKIHKETRQGTILYVLAPNESLTDELSKLEAEDGLLKGELKIDDGRHISSDQRKRAYATIADIAIHTGYLPEELKEIMKYWYIAETGADYFSLSDCSMTTARLFINYLIDFAMKWEIPLMDTAINRTDDISAALYSSLMHKRCICCGKAGELHHEDVVGAGRNRKQIIHLGMKVICLCRKHHAEAEKIGRETFNERYKVYGISADKKICKVWNLKTQ